MEYVAGLPSVSAGTIIILLGAISIRSSSSSSGLSVGGFRQIPTAKPEVDGEIHQLCCNHAVIDSIDHRRMVVYTNRPYTHVCTNTPIGYYHRIVV